MQMRALGRTGLKVSALCFGGNVFGWTTDEAASFAVLDAFIEGGGTFIDSADVYSRWVPGNVGGESEVVLGRWMQARGNRQDVIVATKLGSPMGDSPNQGGLSRGWIMRAVEDSLRRLQTDYIDLYQTHRDDPTTPQEETARALDDLVRQGKVRYLGCSNFKAYRLALALGVSAQGGYARYDCVQPPYSLVNRAVYEPELQPLCVEQGIGVIPYSSLGSGFLTGKYRRGGAMPQTPRASGIEQRYMNDGGYAVLDAMDIVAKQYGATPAQVALAWNLAQPGITAPIASATTVEQTRDLLAATELALDANAITALNNASATFA